MRVVIPGGSGQVGSILARHFHSRGDHVTVLSRTPRPKDTGPATSRIPWTVLAWDGRSPGDWARAIDGCDVVINLAGRSVNCRYTPEHLREMMDSRVDSTRVVGEAIAAAARPPRVWLQSSTATIYAHRFDGPNDERTGRLGGAEPGVPRHWKASIDIALAWERELEAADTPRTRKVALRSAMTMSPDAGGIFDTLLALVRRGLGGTAGSGRQFVSWVHHADFVRAIDWIAARDDLAGPVNIAAPNPLPNAEFMRVLREAWRETVVRPGVRSRLALPAPAWLLELGAIFLRTETELILKSRRVVPGRLVGSGFTFEFPDWPAAARHLCRRWRSSRLVTPLPGEY
ncbi:MAG: epimerase [Phycisphaerales bacterium]